MTYTQPDDPAKTPHFVQLAEVLNLLNQLTMKYEEYGGYTVSNPHAPPPLAGGYQGGPEERSFWVMIIVADHQLNEATQDIQQLVNLLQGRYHQKEILCYSHPINRHIPLQSSTSQG